MLPLGLGGCGYLVVGGGDDNLSNLVETQIAGNWDKSELAEHAARRDVAKRVSDFGDQFCRMLASAMITPSSKSFILGRLGKIVSCRQRTTMLG
jgi:hypothetical protein